MISNNQLRSLQALFADDDEEEKRFSAEVQRQRAEHRAKHNAYWDRKLEELRRMREESARWWSECRHRY